MRMKSIFNAAGRRGGVAAAALAFVFAMLDPGNRVIDHTLQDFALKGRVKEVRIEAQSRRYENGKWLETPSRLYETLEFDPAGILMRKTINKNTITFEYDPEGRVIQVLWTKQQRTISEITYEYSPGSGQAKLERRTHDNEVSEVQFEYDAKGRKISEEARQSDGSFLAFAKYEYDNAGRLTRELYPGIGYPYEVSVHYKPNGQQVRTDAYADTEEEFTCSPDGLQLKRRLTHDLAFTSLAIEEWNYQYKYDATGNWIQQEEYLCNYPVFVWLSCEHVATYYRTIEYYPAAGR